MTYRLYTGVFLRRPHGAEGTPAPGKQRATVSPAGTRKRGGARRAAAAAVPNVSAVPCDTRWRRVSAPGTAPLRRCVAARGSPTGKRYHYCLKALDCDEKPHLRLRVPALRPAEVRVGQPRQL